MHVFGKRLATLSLMITILVSASVMLPNVTDAQTHVRRQTSASEQRASDWWAYWEQLFEERRFDRPDSAPAAPTSAPEPTSAQETTPAEAGAATLEAMEVEVLNLINAYRQQNGLQPLANNSTLNVSSHNHSQDMAQRGYFSHTTPEGLSPFDRMAAAGYSCGTMGENLAAGQRTAQQAFEGWQDSPGHNANMLNANYAVIGIGVVYVPDSPYGYYWTTNFGGC